MIFLVFTLDMWGHVPADCHEFSCECMKPCPECPDDDARPSCETCKGTGEIHDDDACSCHEDLNAQHSAGRIDAGDHYTHATILQTLIDDGYLKEAAATECEIEDPNGMDEWLEVNDKQGRRLLGLQAVQEGDEG